MKVLPKTAADMKFLFLFIIVILLAGCKSRQPIDTYFPIEDTMYQNNESMENTINTNFYSLIQDETTIVVFNGEEISLKKLNSLRDSIDSTYTISIFKSESDLKKHKINYNKYKALILINKSP